jgi:hypothetical protein
MRRRWRASVAGRLDRTTGVAHHAGQRWADPLSPPDRAWSPRARGRPGVPLAGFGDLQLGDDGKEAPAVGGLGRHGLCLASRSMNSSLLVLALGEEGAHFGAEPVRCFDGTDRANARQDDQS